MRKAVVFDLDGTLINSLPDIANAMNKVLKAYGLPTHPERAYRLFTGDGARNLTIRALGDRQDMLETVLKAYSQEYGQNSRVASAPYPGLAELIDRLNVAGMRVCVLSNKDDADSQEVVRHYFPSQAFALIRGRLDGVPIKPDPTALLMIVEHLGLEIADFWYVGDTQTDMRTALNAGMDSIAVTWGFQTRDEIAPGRPGRYVDSAEALGAVLLG